MTDQPPKIAKYREPAAKKIKLGFIKYYNLLVDSIAMLQAKANELNKLKDNEPTTRIDTGEKYVIVLKYLNLLKELRNDTESTLLQGRNLQPDRNAIEANGLTETARNNYNKELHRLIIAMANVPNRTAFLSGQMDKFREHILHFNDEFELYLRKKREIGGFRFWLSRFRENFLDGLRRFSNNDYTEIKPSVNLSSIGISKALYREIPSNLLLFKEVYLPKQEPATVEEKSQSTLTPG